MNLIIVLKSKLNYIIFRKEAKLLGLKINLKNFHNFTKMLTFTIWKNYINNTTLLFDLKI